VDPIAVPAALRCPICTDVFEDPVDAGGKPCLHVFCRACLVPALGVNSSCPLCREPMRREQLRSSHTIASILDEIQVRCIWRCGWTGHRDARDGHAAACPKRLLAETLQRLDVANRERDEARYQLRRVDELHAMQLQETQHQLEAAKREIDEARWCLGSVARELDEARERLESVTGEMAELRRQLAHAKDGGRNKIRSTPKGGRQNSSGDRDDFERESVVRLEASSSSWVVQTDEVQGGQNSSGDRDDFERESVVRLEASSSSWVVQTDEVQGGQNSSGDRDDFERESVVRWVASPSPRVFQTDEVEGGQNSNADRDDFERESLVRWVASPITRVFQTDEV